MFTKLRDAYRQLVEALTGHARSVREADAKFREFYGLDPVPEQHELPAVQAPTTEALPAAAATLADASHTDADPSAEPVPAGHAPGVNGTGRRHRNAAK